MDTKSKEKNKSKTFNKRIRRPRDQKETPIQIAENEFELLTAYLNIISDNLATYLKKELSYRLNNVICPIIKPSKVSKDVLDGTAKLKNEISAVLIFEDKEVHDIFVLFARENRYLNIDIKDKIIKVENSGKYQYFNIEMTSHDNIYTFTIYSRRRFTVTGMIKKRGLFSRF